MARVGYVVIINALLVHGSGIIRIVNFYRRTWPARHIDEASLLEHDVNSNHMVPVLPPHTPKYR